MANIRGILQATCPGRLVIGTSWVTRSGVEVRGELERGFFTWGKVRPLTQQHSPLISVRFQATPPSSARDPRRRRSP
eukprot:1195994-Prorocentrum_minimum.AAC.7